MWCRIFLPISFPDQSGVAGKREIFRAGLATSVFLSPSTVSPSQQACWKATLPHSTKTLYLSIFCPNTQLVHLMCFKVPTSPFFPWGSSVISPWATPSAIPSQSTSVFPFEPPKLPFSYWWYHSLVVIHSQQVPMQFLCKYLGPISGWPEFSKGWSITGACIRTRGWTAGDGSTNQLLNMRRKCYQVPGREPWCWESCLCSNLKIFPSQCIQMCFHCF